MIISPKELDFKSFIDVSILTKPLYIQKSRYKTLHICFLIRTSTKCHQMDRRYKNVFLNAEVKTEIASSRSLSKEMHTVHNISCIQVSDTDFPYSKFCAEKLLLTLSTVKRTRALVTSLIQHYIIQYIVSGAVVLEHAVTNPRDRFGYVQCDVHSFYYTRQKR